MIRHQNGLSDYHHGTLRSRSVLAIFNTLKELVSVNEIKKVRFEQEDLNELLFSGPRTMIEMEWSANLMA